MEVLKPKKLRDAVAVRYKDKPPTQVLTGDGWYKGISQKSRINQECKNAMKLEDDMDWSLATWEGSRCETLRRWERLPLERVIAALEEMQELSEMLSEPTVSRAGIEESQSDYGAKDKNDNR